MGKAKTIKLEFEVEASLYLKFIEQQLEDFEVDIFENLQERVDHIFYDGPNYKKVEKQISDLVLERKSQLESILRNALNGCVAHLIKYGYVDVDPFHFSFDDQQKIKNEILQILEEEWLEKLQKIQEAEELEDKKKEEKLLKDLAKQHGYKLVKA